MNLNKNQRRFFTEAINHFGEGSNDVRLIELREFAEKNELIVPTSALKNYCQEEGQTRGHYNLLLTGIEPEVEEIPLVKPSELHPFIAGGNPIVDSSLYVSDPAQPKTKLNIKPMQEFNAKGMRELRYQNPVYLVLDQEMVTYAVCSNPSKAYERIIGNILHDHGVKSLETVKKELRYTGKCLIESNSTSLIGVITVMEIE